MMYDNQKTFNKVYEHLITQGAKSLNGDGDTAYRGCDERRCAIGVLIDDEHYSPDFEGGSVWATGVYQSVQKSGWGVEIDLLEALQDIHDVVAPDEWSNSLRSCAELWNLDVPER